MLWTIARRIGELTRSDLTPASDRQRRRRSRRRNPNLMTFPVAAMIAGGWLSGVVPDVVRLDPAAAADFVRSPPVLGSALVLTAAIASLRLMIRRNHDPLLAWAKVITAIAARDVAAFITVIVCNLARP